MISAIVLAAGESTRYGRPKQIEFLEPVLRNLRPARVGEIVVILGANAEEVRMKVQFQREKIVINPRYADGISTSIQAGLRAVSGDAALIVLADQPFVRPETIEILIATFERRRPKIALPTFAGKRGNPVVIDRSLFAAMMEIRGDVGFRAIFGDYAGEIVSVPVNDEGVITDIDTPDDLSNIR